MIDLTVMIYDYSSLGKTEECGKFQLIIRILQLKNKKVLYPLWAFSYPTVVKSYYKQGQQQFCFWNAADENCRLTCDWKTEYESTVIGKNKSQSTKTLGSFMQVFVLITCHIIFSKPVFIIAYVYCPNIVLPSFTLTYRTLIKNVANK